MADTSSNINRIDQLNRRLASRRRSTNFASTLTLIIGLIAIGLLSFYFYYGYKQFQEVTDPKMLITLVKDQVNSNLPEVRNMAAQEIRASAPQWAQEASNELIKQMPTARAEIEKQIRAFLDSQLIEAKTITQAKFRQMIADNRAEVKEAVDTILSDKESQEFINAFMPVVEKSVAIDVQNNASEALGGFVDLNDRLEKLSKGEGLSELEKQQRYVLGLVQRLRVEESELK
jgi:hypothetical protein